MDADIAQRLIDLNKGFYQKLAGPFSASRERLQPGVMRILETIPLVASVLDLGCGNGGVALELERRGFAGRYIGLDFTDELLQIARKGMHEMMSSGMRHAGRGQHASSYKFTKADLTSDFVSQTEIEGGEFDFVFAFAVLHHIPGREKRVSFLQQVERLLAKPTAGGSETRPHSTGGVFFHSEWQFLNSERLRERIQPWKTIGMTKDDVHEGDYLLDWRREGQGLRYVHHFNEQELEGLADESGFYVVKTFYSNGEGGRLGIYQRWGASA
ncbi:MAG: class I SAM-dependent methyltransferase [Anaerolineales bacterium]